MLSPAAAASGIGDIAVYMYSLKNLPYTVRIITKDKIVINIDPSKVTAHNGIDSRKPVLLTASTISCGITVSLDTPSQTVSVIDWIIPCTISNIFVISSIP